jgi:hypothetical protein
VSHPIFRHVIYTDGRVLEYPNVPSALSDSLGNIVSLSTIKVLGNHSIPSKPYHRYEIQS